MYTDINSHLIANFKLAQIKSSSGNVARGPISEKPVFNGPM
jgi:hypothetical protein